MRLRPGGGLTAAGRSRLSSSHPQCRACWTAKLDLLKGLRALGCVLLVGQQPILAQIGQVTEPIPRAGVD